MIANENGKEQVNGNNQGLSVEQLATLAERFPAHTLFWLARGTLSAAKPNASPTTVRLAEKRNQIAK
jgi:hypothetical protein